MGASSSTPQPATEFHVNVLKGKSSGPLSYENVAQANKAICRLVYSDSLTVTGVAVCFKCNDTLLYGIVTCYTATPATVTLQYRSIVAADEHGTVSHSINPVFAFACPVLGMSFVKFESDVVDSLKQCECFFYDLEQQNAMITADKPVYLVAGSTEACISGNATYACGQSIEMYGQDLHYSMTCSFEATAGLPVIDSTGQLVAIHKAIETDGQYIAVSISTITTALKQLNMTRSSPAAPVSIISNPINLSSYGTDLEENGLEILSLPTSSRYNGCVMYVSPASPFITPIWFMPTYLGWYWSPTEPDGDKYPNWMSVDRLEVVGGEWHGQIPAYKNISIIRWLNQHNISNSST